MKLIIFTQKDLSITLMPYLNYIIEILQESSAPLSAIEIADILKSKGIQRLYSLKDITPTQIRIRINSNKNLIDIIETSPLTYRVKGEYNDLWVLKTVHEDDKGSKTIESYGDSLKEYYNYDNNVANSKQINANDLAILIDKEKILGFVKIESVDNTNGQKNIRRCPECPSTTIDKRKTKKPTYRCNQGHEFDTPKSELRDVIKYSARFNSFIPIGTLNHDLIQLRPYYSQGYKQNMSMQRLDIASLALFDGIKDKLMNERLIHPDLDPNQGLTKEDEEQYQSNNKDEREITLRAIRQRRGQQEFRRKLLKRFNSTCVITGCKIVDILEAAHINPYRGNNDNHISNGLLLRADIHTLFDLDLIKINPVHYTVEIDKKLMGSEYEQYDGLSLIDYERLISKEALIIKFEQKIKVGNSIKIKLGTESQQYMAYLRKHVLKK